MSKPPKIDRKQLKGPDEFMKKGQAFLDVLAENRALLAGALVLILVGVAGVYGYQWWQSSRVERGWTAYDEAMKAPEPVRYDKLKALDAELGSSRPRYFARIALADHFYKEANAAKDAAAGTQNALQAAEWYGKALEFSGLAPTERQLVLIDQGNAYELANKVDDALRSYQAASAEKGEATGYALLNEGRAWEMKKDPAKATSAYEKVVADFAGTEYAKLAKNYLRLLKSPLFQSLGTPAS